MIDDGDDGFAELQQFINDQKQSKQTATESNNVVHQSENNLQINIHEQIAFNKKDNLYRNLAKFAGEKELNDEEPSSKKLKYNANWDDPDDNDAVIGDVMHDNKKRSYSHLNKNKLFEEHLRNKFVDTQPETKWINSDDDDDEDESDSDDISKNLLRTIGFKGINSELPSQIIQNKRLKDLNRATYAEKRITSVQFHPKSTVGIVAGLCGVVSLYAIDGIKNEKLHSSHFEKFPIKCVKLYDHGNKMIVGGIKKYFYSVDLMTAKENRIFLPDNITKLSIFDISLCQKYMCVAGRFGEIHLFDVKSKELIHTYKQENSCVSLQFTSDSKKIISHSSNNEISIYDIKTQRIQHVFIDDGCICGKSIAISPNMKMIATGSEEGVVNIYDYDSVFNAKYPTPKKIIYNLTTTITGAKFNHSSEILGIYSDIVAGACKLIHFPSATVYSNFPTQNANIGHVTTLEFSPNSGYMAIGNRNKEVPLFRLKHFKEY